MKLATWNLQRLTRPTSVRLSRVRPYLDAVNADVWVLTETGEEVSPGPGYEGVATTEFDRASHYPGEVWTKIWSRWPIERLAPVSDPARCVAARVIPPHRAPFIVYGTVLPWPSSTWRGLASKGGVAFGAAGVTRGSIGSVLARVRSAREECECFVEAAGEGRHWGDCSCRIVPQGSYV